MPEVVLPDGRILDIPDDAPPEQLAAVKAKLASQYGNQPAPAGKLESFGRDLVSGFGNAAAGVVRGMQTAAGTFGPVDKGLAPEDSGTSAMPRTNALARTLGDTAQSMEDYYREVAAKSTNNPYVQKATRAVGGGLSTGIATPTSIMSSAGAGTAEEAANRMAPNNPLASVGAQLVGGTLAGGAVALAGRARPQSAEIAREAIEGFSEQQLLAAQAYKNQQAARGIDIDLAQALEATASRSGNVGNVRDVVATRSQGNKTAETLRQQPEQLAREAQMTAAGMPGRNYSPEQNANNLQEVATGRLKQATDARGAAVKQMYAEAGDLPPESRDELIRVINKSINQPGMTEVAIARGKEMIRKLSGADDKLEGAVTAARAKVDAATSPAARAQARIELAGANAELQAATQNPLKALDVDTWIGELRGPWQGQPLKQAYPKEQGQVKFLAGELNKAFQEMSPQVKAAEARFKQITEDTINPLKQGPVGTVTQPRGYDPATQAMVSKFDGILNRGTDPTSRVSSIRTLGKELAQKDPAAFEDSFKGWLSGKIKPATAEGVGTSPLPSDPQMAQQLWNNLFKDGHQWQGIKDAASVMAEVKGQNPVELLRGLENFRQLTKAMTNRPAIPAGASPQDLARMGGNSQLANAVRVFSFLPVNKLGEGIERATLGKTLSEFDTILTSPEGAEMLIKLGKVPVMSKKAQVILGTWGGMVGNSDGLSNDNTP